MKIYIINNIARCSCIWISYINCIAKAIVFIKDLCHFVVRPVGDIGHWHFAVRHPFIIVKNCGNFYGIVWTKPGRIMRLRISFLHEANEKNKENDYEKKPAHILKIQIKTPLTKRQAN